MYGNVVLGCDHHDFEDAIERAKESRGVFLDTDLTAADWQGLIETFKAVVAKQLGRPSPRTCANSSGAPSVPCSAPG